MAGSKFQYDESGGTFFYFLLSFLALILIPISYYLWPKKGKKEEVSSAQYKCHCELCQVKQNRLTLNEPLKKWKSVLTKCLIVIGWLAFLATAYKVAHLERDYVDWNPFDILQVDRGASQAEIKRAYRKLSLLYHPDKDTGDAKKFLQLTKAHAALTDDEARKNWELYGNPDGPGAMSFGIALPSWIVEKENSFWVLGLYALVFMVALPVVVGVWWRRSIKFGGDKVLLETTKLYYYYINKTPQMALKRALTIVAGSFEFDKSHNNEIIERPTDNEEVPMLIKEFMNFGKSKEPCLSYSYSIKARAILFAHLSRMELPANTLEQDRLYIVKKCPYLINELVQCVAKMIMIALSGHAHSMPSLETIESCMRLSPMIVQALWEKKHPVLQLPHIQEDVLKHFNRKSRSVKNMRDLVTLSYEVRRDMLRDLTQEQFDDVMKVCCQMPHIEIVVKAEGDDKSSTISCGAIVTVTIKLQRRRLLSEDFKPPQIEENYSLKDSTDEDSDEQNETKPVENEVTVKKKPPVWQKQKKKGKSQKPKRKLKQGKFKKPSQVEVKPEPGKESKDTAKAKQKSEKDGSDSSDDECSSKGSQSDAEKEDKDKNAEADDDDDDEDDENWTQLQSRLSHKEKVTESKSLISHTVHCPYFPEEKQEYWWLYICDLKQRLLMTAPYYVTDLVDKKEITLQITAPDKIGIYSYIVHLRSDSYVDSDFKVQFKLDVKEAEKVENPIYGISDDEKDESEKEDEDTTGLMTDDSLSESDDDDDK